MGKTRNLGNLASNNSLVSDINNNNIGIGTTIATSALTVTGDVLVSGVVTATNFIGNGSGLTGAGSTVVIDNSTNETVYPILTSQTSGTVTASKVSTQKLTFNPSTGSLTSIAASIGNVKIGTGNTDLIVTGDARVTGILTIGTASVTVDGQNNNIKVGSATTIDILGFKIGSSTLHSSGLEVVNVNATGIITASTFIGDFDSPGISTFTTIYVGTGVTISSGIVTATSFVGDGSRLTGIGATVLIDNSTNAIFYPLFTQTTSGNILQTKISTTKLTFNPSSGVFSSTQLNDAGGNIRALTNNAKGSSYTLVVGDVGELINITTGGVTIPSGVFSAGDNVTIYNNSSSQQTITQGSGVTLRLVGTTSTGNRSLDQRGLATVLCVASNEFVISGGGLA